MHGNEYDSDMRPPPKGGLGFKKELLKEKIESELEKLKKDLQEI